MVFVIFNLSWFAIIAITFYQQYKEGHINLTAYKTIMIIVSFLVAGASIYEYGFRKFKNLYDVEKYKNAVLEETVKDIYDKGTFTRGDTTFWYKDSSVANISIDSLVEEN